MRKFAIFGLLFSGLIFVSACGYPDYYDDLYEGLAAVSDDKGEFHVNRYGEPAYSQRYKQVRRFFYRLAEVKDENGWHHIRRDGSPLYPERYKYIGPFSRNGIAVVHGYDGLSFHIKRDGKELYSQRYKRVFEFTSHENDDELAQAKDENGWFHIRLDGSPLYAERYKYVGKYSGFRRFLFAAAKDESGSFHIGLDGKPAYSMRFKNVSSFSFSYDVSSFPYERASAWLDVMERGVKREKKFYLEIRYDGSIHMEATKKLE